MGFCLHAAAAVCRPSLNFPTDWVSNIGGYAVGQLLVNTKAEQRKTCYKNVYAAANTLCAFLHEYLLYAMELASVSHLYSGWLTSTVVDQ